MELTSGAKIARARKAIGLSQRRLGEELGLSQTLISKWERDSPEAGPVRLRQIAKVCGVSPRSLVNLSDEIETGA
jgi:transcriptional regulator with XRE-family HTH domain